MKALDISASLVCPECLQVMDCLQNLPEAKNGRVEFSCRTMHCSEKGKVYLYKIPTIPLERKL
jgi:hypothetical protein